MTLFELSALLIAINRLYTLPKQRAFFYSAHRSSWIKEKSITPHYAIGWFNRRLHSIWLKYHIQNITGDKKTKKMWNYAVIERLSWLFILLLIFWKSYFNSLWYLFCMSNWKLKPKRKIQSKCMNANILAVVKSFQRNMRAFIIESAFKCLKYKSKHRHRRIYLPLSVEKV